MNLASPLRLDWEPPGGRELLRGLSNPILWVLSLEAALIGPALFQRHLGSLFLIILLQVFVTLFLELVYYRSVIEPAQPLRRFLRRLLVLTPWSVWILCVQVSMGIFGFLLFILPGLYLYSRLSLALGLIAADRPGISTHPLRASWTFTERRQGLFFGCYVGTLLYGALVFWATRSLGPPLSMVVIAIRSVLGFPVFAGWKAFRAESCSRAIRAQPEEVLAALAAEPKSAGLEQWIVRGLAVIGFFVLFLALSMGIGLMMRTPLGGSAFRHLIRLAGTGGDVVVHGKTVLKVPAPWIATLERPFSGSQAVSYRLMALGKVTRDHPLIRVAWLPVEAPATLDLPTAQRLSGLVTRGMDALELEQVKILNRLYELERRQLAEYQPAGLSVVQTPDPPGWIVMRSRGAPPRATVKRDRFMPCQGGLLVFSDTLYSWQDGNAIDAMERPLLHGLCAATPP